jgi:hypothetical protein
MVSKVANEKGWFVSKKMVWRQKMVLEAEEKKVFN